MARELVKQENVNSADSDYPFGRIRDNDGTGNGTPINEKLYGDVHQFFAKLMEEGNIQPNNLPDSEYNGFQLFDALKGVWNNIGDALKPAFQNSWTNYNTGTHQRARFKKAKGRVYLGGLVMGGSTGTTAFTLPNGYRPQKITLMAAAADTVVTYVSVTSAGAVNITHNSAAFISLDGLSFPID